jgi:hypothetical protein
MANLEKGEMNLIIVGVGTILLMGSPLASVFGIGQAAAAIRIRGDYMNLATAGLILSGVHVGVVVGLFSLAMWQG